MKTAGDFTTLYLHVYDWPTDGELVVPGLKSKVSKAYLLTDKSRKLSIKKSKDGMSVKVPAQAGSAISTTVILEIKGPVSVEAAPKIVASAPNTYQNETSNYGPQFAFDGSKDTRWATDDSTSQTWIAVDLGASQKISRVRISEAYAGRVQQYELQSRQAGEWKTFLTGATLGADIELTFPPVTAREFRLNILSAKQGPTINEIEWLNK